LVKKLVANWDTQSAVEKVMLLADSKAHRSVEKMANRMVEQKDVLKAVLMV
jgi:hypothetical protein